ncbi:phage tail protein [Mesorhizobium cantuariense]|uniref:Phage tail protein n=1 Tax=Mesorhizobium cantuariense TaxID=1300275 RepID=A0ABV7ML75_9HYPH
MSLPTFSPPVAPSPGTAFKPTIKILEADFGDGYSQPTPKGLNNIRETLTLAWGGLTDWQMVEINDFFRARRGSEPFWFAPVGDAAARLWTCKEWDRKTDQGIWQMTATLVESFSLQA